MKTTKITENVFFAYKIQSMVTKVVDLWLRSRINSIFCYNIIIYLFVLPVESSLVLHPRNSCRGRVWSHPIYWSRTVPTCCQGYGRAAEPTCWYARGRGDHAASCGRRRVAARRGAELAARLHRLLDGSGETRKGRSSNQKHPWSLEKSVKIILLLIATICTAIYVLENEHCSFTILPIDVVGLTSRLAVLAGVLFALFLEECN